MLGGMLERLTSGISGLVDHAKQLSGNAANTAYHVVGEKVPTSHDFDLDGGDGGEEEPKVIDGSSAGTSNGAATGKATLHKRGKKTDGSNPFDADADPLADDDFDLLLNGTSTKDSFDPRGEGDAL